MSFELIPKYFHKYLFNKEVKHFILDPLTCIIRCSILAFKPHGTKISIFETS